MSYFVSCSTITGKPALGCTITGIEAAVRTRSTIGSSCFGPREQFTPRASAPKASRVITIDSTVVPKKVVPFSSKLMVANRGSREFSFAAIIAALIS